MILIVFMLFGISSSLPCRCIRHMSYTSYCREPSIWSRTLHFFSLSTLELSKDQSLAGNTYWALFSQTFSCFIYPRFGMSVSVFWCLLNVSLLPRSLLTGMFCCSWTETAAPKSLVWFNIIVQVARRQYVNKDDIWLTHHKRKHC